MFNLKILDMAEKRWGRDVRVVEIPPGKGWYEDSEGRIVVN